MPVSSKNREWVQSSHTAVNRECQVQGKRYASSSSHATQIMKAKLETRCGVASASVYLRAGRSWTSDALRSAISASWLVGDNVMVNAYSCPSLSSRSEVNSP
jgi:hypothetical protein